MNISASSAPCKLSGKDYRIAPLTDHSIGELTQWVRGHFLRSVSLGQLEDKDRDAACEYSLSIEWDSDVGQKLLIETTAGFAWLMYQSLLPTTPGITHDACRMLIDDPVNIDAFWTVFESVNDLHIEFPETGEVAQKKNGQTGETNTTTS